MEARQPVAESVASKPKQMSASQIAHEILSSGKVI